MGDVREDFLGLDGWVTYERTSWAGWMDGVKTALNKRRLDVKGRRSEPNLLL